MQHNSPTNSLQQFGFNGVGGSVTGPLLLTVPPVGGLDSIMKSYVDGKLANLNIGNITKGTVRVERFPELTGDVVSVEGSGVINLKPSGVTAGTYSKVGINKNGIVTGGFNLSDLDIPTLGFGKFVSLPTTLTGYGITDALSKNGGELTNYLNTSVVPTQSLHVVSKEWVDGLVVKNNAGYPGDIKIEPTDVTPTGFFRCNGGFAMKADYPELYAVIGDQFTTQLQQGSGTPWAQQGNMGGSGVVGAWTNGVSLPGNLHDSQAVVTKNRVYLIGGCNLTNSGVTTVYTAPINADGTLGAWVGATSLPVGLRRSSVIVTKNRIYVLGGWGSTGAVATSYTAVINSDGSLGAWVAAGNLPGVLAFSSCLVTRNRVYLLGGVVVSGVDPSSVVYTAPINADGTLGGWVSAPSLPGPIAAGNLIVTKNRVYVTSGDSSGVSGRTVYVATINTDCTIGAWSSAPQLPAGVSHSAALVDKNFAYLFGGLLSGTSISVVYKALINQDGTLGTWGFDVNLPYGLSRSQLIVTKNRIHLLGGFTTATASVVLTAPFTGGGVNDYSPYYDGTITIPVTDSFKLPDYTSKEVVGKYYYIKF